MKKWGVTALISLLILAAVGFWGFKEYRNKIMLETYLNNRYQMSFYNLLGRVQSMEVLLAKSLAVAGEPDDTLIFSEIWLQSEGARESLTQLPLTSNIVARTAKFLTQAGDYARVLARDINNGGELSEEEYQTLSTLYKQAEQLNKELHDMEVKIADGKLSISELTQAARQELKKGEVTNASANFQSIDKNMQGFPTLIYDGPFSDHLDRAQPVGLSGESITADEARNILRKFIDNHNDKEYRAQVTGRVRERIAGYQVELLPTQGSGGRITGNVSEKGGKVVWYLNSRALGEPKITLEEALDKAEQFLASRGYKGLVNIYHQTQNGMTIFNFTPIQEGVILYPDQVKINVAMDNGQIIGFDARGYLMAHKQRDIPNPEITADQALEKVNKRMEIMGTRLTIIPTDAGKEKLSYEISGQLNGESYLVYVNAITGKTDQVLKLIQAPNGTLTM
ncbi:germination protein YpeB [Desulforamulus ferrireducens]|uniref:Germination protein YpeB n=1 Tax=Desulforamulus ferrireducens TaxID=1833852 RepID=A0A1S6J082_9FIRM|nr:germination protein YpeB [Desulforamulus ferrireducens]AQS60420.1 germination protein YpeB [Desulforamulus ferrireducens]